MRLRVCPPMLFAPLKLPPTKILPSACTAIDIDITVRVRVESHVERAVRIQSGNVVARHAQNAGKDAADENLAVRLNGGGVNSTGADDAEIERLVEPAVGFQPGDVVARTVAPPFGASVMKTPPARILPSACTAIESTDCPLAFGSNESAKPVAASSRAMRLRVCPPMLSLMKVPPAKILPSACTAIAKT